MHTEWVCSVKVTMKVGLLNFRQRVDESLGLTMTTDNIAGTKNQ